MLNNSLPAELPFEEAAQVWLDSQQLPGVYDRARYVTPRTLKDDGQYIDALRRFFGALPLREIHIGHVREYQALRSSGQLGVPENVVLDRCARKRRCSVEKLREVPEWWEYAQKKVRAARREVGANKINQELSVLSRVLKRAKLWEGELELHYQPLRSELPDVPRSLAPEEQKKFLQVAASREEWQLVYWYAQVAFETTATNCEMRGLRLADVNLYQQVMAIRPKYAKNRFRVRTIPLTPNALWAFERIKERARTLGSVAEDHHLFPFGQRGGYSYDPTKPMSNSGIKKPWNAVREEAGVPWFRIHDLRHTAITRMAEAGVPIAVIMGVAGHISARMTQHYTQISEAAKRKALMEAFADASRKPPSRAAARRMSAHANA